MGTAGFAWLLGEGPRAAARQYAGLLGIAGGSALLGVPTQPERASVLLVIAVADVALAVLAWVLPWSRWQGYAPAALALPALVVLAVATWAFGGFAAGTGPFFVLLFAWLGLHFSTWIIAGVAPLAAVAYVAPLVATDQPPQVVGSVTVLLPTIVGLGLLVSGQAAYQREQRAVIARMERWRAALSSTLAHDIRSPLTSVQLTLETLQETDQGVPADQTQAMIAAALRQTLRIRRLTTGLLDAERVETTGGLRLRRSRFALRLAVDDAMAYLAGSDVTNDVPRDLMVYADPERLEQILINLSGNAIRHGKPPVVIGAEQGPGGTHITVRDHGAGVPDSVVPHLFSRFGSTGDNPQSVGLGLWIVRELARAHGGDVHYEPADPGASFTVTLPYEPAAVG
jgi:signal transduction histidine kinase